MNLRTSVLRLGSANVAMLVAHVATIILLGLVARASDLGLFLLCLSIAQTFAAFATCRFDSALPAARSPIEIAALLVWSSGAAIAATILTFALILGARALDLFELRAMSPGGAAMTALLMTAITAGQIGRYTQIRTQQLGRIETATYTRAVALLALRGGFAACIAIVPVAVVVANQAMTLLAVELAASAAFAYAVRPALARGSLRIAMRWRILRATAARNWKFPVLETPSAMIDSLANNAPIYLVTQFFGLTATAAFGLAFRALVVPFGQLALALTEVLQSHYAQLLRNRDMVAFARLFRRSSAIGAILGAIGCIAIYLALEPIVALVAGAKLGLFAQICVIIGPWVAMSIVININSRLVPLLRAQELKLVYDVSSAAGIAAVCAVQLVFHLALLDFLRVLTAAQVVTFGIYWLMLAYAVRRVAKRGSAAAVRAA